jgi:hypothetical protein
VEPIIATTGISFYVFEGRDDWLDDLSHGPFLTLKPDPSSKAQFMGEQALYCALRSGSRADWVRLIGHVDANPISGQPVDLTHYDEATSNPRVGIRTRVKATSTIKPEYLAIEWKVEYVKDHATQEEKATTWAHRAELIDEGTFTIPRRATVCLFHRVSTDRGYSIFIRISSVEPP